MKMSLLKIGLILLAATLAGRSYAQNPNVNITGTIQGANGLPAANTLLTFTPTQTFFVVGTSTGGCGGAGTTLLEHNGTPLVDQCILNFNDTTPAAPTGFTNVIFRTDSSGNLSAYVPTGGGGTGCIASGASGTFQLSDGSGGCFAAYADYGIQTANTFTFGGGLSSPNPYAGFNIFAGQYGVKIRDGQTGNIDGGHVQIDSVGAGILLTTEQGPTGDNSPINANSHGGILLSDASSHSVTLQETGTGGMALNAGSGGFSLLGGIQGSTDIIDGYNLTIAGEGTTAVTDDLKLRSQTNHIQLHSGTTSNTGYSALDTSNIVSGDAFGIVVPRFSGTWMLYTGSLTAGHCIGVNGTANGFVDVGTCGSGGSGPTLQTNGTNNTSQTTLNFVNPSSFNGLTFTFSNPTAGNETFAVGGTLSNAGLANPSMTINGTSCTLGGSCSVSGGGGFTNPMTTAGDLIDGGAGGGAQRLGIGSTGQVLTVVSGAPAWAAAPATIAAVSHQWLNSFTASTGAFTQTQPAFTDISGQTTLTQLPTLSANTVLGALTATTPSGLAMPSCSGASNALIWTSGTGFGCNTISGGGAVTSVSNSDGSLIISPTTGAVVASINLAHANVFTALQTAPAYATNGTTQGLDALGVGTGAISTTGFPTNYAGWIGPATGTPTYFASLPNANPSSAAIMILGAAATVNGVSQAAVSTLAGTTTTVLHGNASGAPAYSAVVLTTDVSGILPAGNGGTGVANTATLTLGTSNQNWATLGTGIVKNTTTTGAISDAASTDVIGLWTGTCSSGTFLRGDGACAAASGSTGLSGMTAGQVPIAATATTVTSSEALAGAGAGITTGPTTSTTNDIASMNGTNGQIKDSGVLATSVLLGASLAAGVVHAPGASQTMTSSLIVAADITNATITGAKLVNNTVTATQLAAQYSKDSCTEVWGGSGTSFALTSGDDAISNNTCYNDSGVTRTITAVKCRSDIASNTTTVNPTFGSAGTGTTILSGSLTCGSSLAYSSTGTVSNASWTTGTGINPVMGGTLTGTSIAVIVEYTY